MLALNHLWEWIFNLFFATPKTKILKPTGSVTPMEVYLLPGPTLLLNPQHLSSTPPILALWVLANTFTNFTISSTTLISYHYKHSNLVAGGSAINSSITSATIGNATTCIYHCYGTDTPSATPLLY